MAPMTISVSFNEPPATCALCGRAVPIEDALVLDQTSSLTVESEVEGTAMSLSITPGERLVVCAECGGLEGLSAPD
jgi:hypothetical protein